MHALFGSAKDYSKGFMNQNNQRSKDRGRGNSRRRRRPNNKGRSTKNSPAPKDKSPSEHKTILKRFGVVFYDTFNQAKEDGPQLLEKAKEVDQLNIVIKAEGSMDDPELLQYGKLYAGAAWAIIHQRRVEEGWYNDPH